MSRIGHISDLPLPSGDGVVSQQDRDTLVGLVPMGTSAAIPPVCRVDAVFVACQAEAVFVTETSDALMEV